MRRDVVVIVGASSGIGRATAHAFARRGARLVLAARDQRSLDAVADECSELSAQAVTVVADVDERADVQAVARTALERFGRIDVWVGAASVFGYGEFEQMPADVFDQIVHTNLIGQANGARAVLPVFRRQGSGTLVIIGSVYSKVTSPYVSAYVASKFGVLALAEVIGHELRTQRGIHVCTVLPATVDTPIYQHAANFTGQHVHPLVPIVSPRRVARAIVGLSRRPRPTVVVGRVQGLFIPLRAVAPRATGMLLLALQRMVGLRGKGVAPSVGTVFEPDGDSNRVTGGWRSTGLRVAVFTGVGLAAAGVLASRGIRR